MFTKLPIDHLTNNIVEMLKVSFIGLLFDNLKCLIIPRNTNFDDLPFDFYQRLITRRRIYHIHDNIVERLNNVLIVDVYTD